MTRDDYAGRVPVGHAPGCCCLRCRQARAVATLTRRAVRATRELAQPPLWRAKPTRSAPPPSPEVEAEIARLRERLQSVKEHEAELIARDIRDAVRRLPHEPSAAPPPQKRLPPPQTPVAAYRAARARGGIVREPDMRGRS